MNYIKYHTILLVYFFTISHSVYSNTISLFEAEELGLKNRVDVIEKKIALDLQENNYIATIRSYFPEVSVNYSRNKTVIQRDDDSQRYRIGLNVSQPIFDGLAFFEKEDIAKINYQLAALEFSEIRRKLRYEIREIFFEVQKAEDNSGILEYRVNSARDLYEKSMIEERNGNLSKLDLLEVQNQYELAKLEKERSVESYNRALQNLEIALRVPRNTYTGIKRFEATVTVKEDNDYRQRLIDSGYLKKSPEVKKVKFGYLMAKKNKLISDTSWLPRVSLEANVGRSGEKWPPTENEWGVGFRVSFNFFGSSLSAGSNYNESKDGYSKSGSSNMTVGIYDNPGWQNDMLQKDLEYLKSADSLKVTMQQMENLLQNSVVDFLMDTRQIDSEKRKEEIMTKKYEINKKKFLMGELTLTELMNVESELVQVRFNLVNLYFELIKKINNLEIRLGLDLGDLDMVHFSGQEMNNVNGMLRTDDQ